MARRLAFRSHLRWCDARSCIRVAVGTYSLAGSVLEKRHKIRGMVGA
jgi:hypothetical protein